VVVTILTSEGSLVRTQLRPPIPRSERCRAASGALAAGDDWPGGCGVTGRDLRRLPSSRPCPAVILAFLFGLWERRWEPDFLRGPAVRLCGSARSPLLWSYCG